MTKLFILTSIPKEAENPYQGICSDPYCLAHIDDKSNQRVFNEGVQAERTHWQSAIKEVDIDQLAYHIQKELEKWGFVTEHEILKTAISDYLKEKGL